jgi:hypothetical protein
MLFWVMTPVTLPSEFQHFRRKNYIHLQELEDGNSPWMLAPPVRLHGVITQNMNYCIILFTRFSLFRDFSPKELDFLELFHIQHFHNMCSCYTYRTRDGLWQGMCVIYVCMLCHCLTVVLFMYLAGDSFMSESVPSDG